MQIESNGKCVPQLTGGFTFALRSTRSRTADVCLAVTAHCRAVTLSCVDEQRWTEHGNTDELVPCPLRSRPRRDQVELPTQDGHMRVRQPKRHRSPPIHRVVARRHVQSRGSPCSQGFQVQRLRRGPFWASRHAARHTQACFSFPNFAPRYQQQQNVRSPKDNAVRSGHR